MEILDDEVLMKDPKKKGGVVKLIHEWVDHLGASKKQEDLSMLNGLIEGVYDRFFNAENPNDVNATLLEILPFYAKK